MTCSARALRRWALTLAIAVLACAPSRRPSGDPGHDPSGVDLEQDGETPTATDGILRPGTRVIVSLGRPSGTSVTTVLPDGTVHVDYRVVQNGRGPAYDVQIRLDDAGLPVAYAAEGHHELGSPVDETFTRDGGTARWRGQQESGEHAGAESAFFVPLAIVPEMAGVLVAAALRAPGRALPLLPRGEARVEPCATATVSAGGRSRELVAYRISGLELTSSYTWFDRDGEWFGTVEPWYSVVPEGWEPAIAPLVDIQTRLRGEHARELATRLAHRPPPAGVALTHARVLDVVRGRWLPDHTVLVVGTDIRWVGPSARADIPEGAELIDLSGKAILPGLIDMHVHMGEADGVLDIATGVTGVRDVGNDPDVLDALVRDFDDGSTIGPHVARFGFIEGRGEKAAASKVTAETPEEAEAAVAAFAERGYDGVKIYNSVKPELVPIIAKAAHARGMKVTGHVPVHMFASEAVAAGYDGIEHVNMVLLEFLAERETDTRDTTRFRLIGEKAADLDLDGRAVRRWLADLARREIVVTPTVGVFEDMLVGVPGEILPSRQTMMERLPLLPARSLRLGGLPIPDDARERYREGFDQMLAMIVALHRAEVPLVVGTDAIAGLWMAYEMELYARAGLANADILRMATLDAAAALGWADRTGSVVAGKRADLFVVDGDPLATMADVGRVTLTMRAGVRYDAAALLAEVGTTALVRND